MRTARRVLVAGALSFAAFGITVPASAVGLPGPPGPGGPTLLPPLQPQPAPSATPGPGLPGIPLPGTPGRVGGPLPGTPALPAVPVLPVAPHLPIVPGLPGLSVPAVPGAPGGVQPNSGVHEMTPAEMGYLPFGHYIDDGIGIPVPVLPPIPTPNFTIPPDTPYDKTGSDQSDYPLRPEIAATPRHGTSRSIAGQVAHAIASHVLLDILAGLALGAAATGVTVARRRSLI